MTSMTVDSELPIVRMVFCLLIQVFIDAARHLLTKCLAKESSELALASRTSPRTVSFVCKCPIATILNPPVRVTGNAANTLNWFFSTSMNGILRRVPDYITVNSELDMISGRHAIRIA
jgi:hypothetical protein